jgi:uncharacterized protein (UPF0264 family)
MTQLLVSVRSAAEAEAALSGCATVIDVKEPDRGALGAADPATWRSVVECVAGRAPVSAALGELYVGERLNASVASLAAQTAGMTFAKVGLAGAAHDRNWQSNWRQVLAAIPPAVSAVAVAYADWKTAAAPRPEEVIDAGAKLGCTMLLLDTFDKSRGHLLDHLPLGTLRPLCSRARESGLQVVLAGSLTKSLLLDILPLEPALVAVRGAACHVNRRGAVDAALVREMSALLDCDSRATGRAQLPVSRGA